MKTQILFLFFLFLLCHITTCFAENKVGFGVSDYNLKEIMVINNVKIVDIARIYNTGTIDLNVSIGWNWLNTTDNIVQPTNKNIYLIPGESKVVFIQITTKTTGEYSGYTDFIPKLPTNSSGNLNVPTGSAKMHLTVMPEGWIPKLVPKILEPFNWIPIFVIISTVVGVGGLGLGYRYMSSRNKSKWNHHKTNTNNKLKKIKKKKANKKWNH